MAVTDPREHHEDLLEWHVEEEVGTELLAERREMEAFQSGWVAIGFVFDEENRVLLIYDEGSELWLAPGGTLLPGESLEEGLTREVREETGVDVSAEEPHGVADVVVTNGDASTSFTVVFFEARAESTDVGEDLGVEDEAIVDAAWFAELPGEVYNREVADAVLSCCDRWAW